MGDEDKEQSRRDFLANTGLGFAAAALLGYGVYRIFSTQKSVPANQPVKTNTPQAAVTIHAPRIDYLDVREHYAPQSNYGQRRTSALDYVVIHSTEGTGQGAEAWMTNPKSKVSAHYLIHEDGSLVRLVDEQFNAYHAGKNANGRSIGVEIAGFANKNGYRFSDAQYEACAKLLKNITDRHGLHREAIVTHGYVSKNLGGTDHTDPEPNFSMERLLRRYDDLVRDSVHVELRTR
jgi:N-acetyl-anhydromuramyl-L-alanine amidase AmpD